MLAGCSGRGVKRENLVQVVSAIVKLQHTKREAKNSTMLQVVIYCD